MKKSRKIIAIVCVMIAGMILMAGCGGEEKDGGDKAKIDAGALAAKLVADVAFEDQLTKADDDTALMLYGLNADQVVSSVVYVGTGATAEEVAVFEGTDEDSAKAIKELADSRVKSQLEDYKDYKPEEVPKLENAILETKGNYVILCVSGDNETANAVIGEMTK